MKTWTGIVFITEDSDWVHILMEAEIEELVWLNISEIWTLGSVMTYKKKNKFVDFPIEKHRLLNEDFLLLSYY